MAETAPQYFPNELIPIEISTPKLQDALDKLQTALRQSVEMINSSPSMSEREPGSQGTIFTGEVGSNK
jgi:hypothetical protein